MGDRSADPGSAGLASAASFIYCCLSGVVPVLLDNNSFAFTDDIKCLSQILEGIKAHIEVLPQYERLPIYKIGRENKPINK